MAEGGKERNIGRLVLQLAGVGLLALVALGLAMNPGKPWSPTMSPARQQIVVTTYDPAAPNPVGPQRQQRKERSLAAMRALGVPLPERDDALPSEGGLRPHDANALRARCVASLLCVMKATGFYTTPVTTLMKAWSLSDQVTPKELTFLTTPEPSQDALAMYARRAEAAHVLLWALGETPALAPPDQRADAKAEWERIRLKGPEAFGKNTPLRSIGELFDAADLYFRLRMVMGERERRGETTPRVDAQVVDERFRTLRWLTFDMGTPWDDLPLE